MEKRLVPKRKVRARVRLADSKVYKGALYAAVQRSDGAPEQVVDRLNDPSEKYLPLALKDMHVLLRKSGIVTVEIPAGQEGEVESPISEETRELHLRLGLSDGSNLQGKVHAVLPAEYSRALDYLNETASAFITLFAGKQAIMVNGRYIIAVSEMLERSEV